MRLYWIITQTHQGANGGGRGIKDIDLMLRAYFPKTARVGISGDALKHDGCGAVRQRSIDDIGVTSDPANIRRTPVNVARAIIENILVGH